MIGNSSFSYNTTFQSTFNMFLRLYNLEMDFGGQDLEDYFQDIQASISLSQFQNQGDFLNIDQKEKNQRQLEKTSAKDEEKQRKIGQKSQKRLIGGQRNSKNQPLFTLTRFGEVASYNLEGGLISRKQYDQQRISEKKQNHQYNRFLSVAHFKAIQLDHPEIIVQSINYLSNLAEHYGQNVKKSLTKESITRHFSQLFKWGATINFYKDSTALLETHLLKIIQELKNSRPSDKPELKIEIQVMGYFLKIICEFNKYIPKIMSSLNWNVSMWGLAKALNLSTPQFKNLKTIYMKNHHNLIFLNGNKFQIKQHLTTYYLLALKHKYKFFKPPSIQKYSLVDTIQQFRANKLEASKKKIRGNKEKITLSSLQSLHRTPKSEKGFLWKKESFEKMKQVTNIFEEIIDQPEFDGNDHHPKLVYLSQRYLVGLDAIRNQFGKFVLKRKKELNEFKNNLNSYMNATITRQLIKNPQCSYKDMYIKTYSLTAIRIKEDYFNDNLFSILLKEVQYQQFKYLGKVFKNINDMINKDISIMFLDSVSLKEEEEQEDEQQEQMMIPSVSIAVTLKGALLCKTCIKPMNQVELLKQYSKMLDEIRPSIILLFDDQFPLPMGLKEQERLFLLRKTHTVLVLPRISLLPNPCKVIADCLKSVLPQHLSGVEEFKEAIQNAIQKFDEEQVKEIVDKEWEKVEKFTSAWSPALLDGQNEERPSRMNDEEEDQSMVEELEGHGRPNEFKMPEPNNLNPFHNIHLQVAKKINGLKYQEEPPIPLQSPEKIQRQEAKSSNEITTLSQPIMENLKYKSVDDLRAHLANLLSRNKKDPFTNNGNFNRRLGEMLSPQTFIYQFNQRL